ncbi:MAG: AMP-binding protein [Actinomycetota bacterium]|nr:AMP-binding protein [Actinomycetota bacterium]
MDMSSQRELHRGSPTRAISQLAVEITAALDGSGPALSFGQVRSKAVAGDIAIVIGTSGSSGLVKEVAFTRKALIASAQASNAFIAAHRGAQFSLLLPLTHIAAVNVIIRSIEVGTLPVDLPNSSAQYPDADFTSIVPTQLFRALNSDARLLRHLQSAQAVLVGGAALAPSLRTQAESVGIHLIETYGMTETCGGCIYDGQGLNGVEFAITDNGVIKLRGTVMATAYLNPPHQFELNDGWFMTKDLGEITNGKLHVLGRVDDVIISGGENLSLTSIEATLAVRFPELECAAFAVDDLQWGQALHIAVVGDVNETEISHYLEAALGQIAKPKGIHLLQSLPLLGIGKVDRLALARMVGYE